MGRIRYAIRSLAKAPLLSLVVILSLGLGIGANTAIFSLLHQVVLASLPVERPEDLTLVTSPQEFKNGRGSTDNSGNMNYAFSYLMFRGLESRARGVAGLTGFRQIAANLAFRSQSVSGGAMLVSGGYFPLLGVKPILGRAIEPEDDRTGGGNPVAVLGYGFWRDKLGGGTDILNQPIHINGQVFTIVGVAPPGFNGTTLGQVSDAFVPMSFKPQLTPNWDGTDRWNDYWIYMLARRQPGQTLAQAAAALNSTYAGLVEEQAKVVPDRNAKRGQRFLQSRLTLKDGRQGNSGLRDGMRTPVLILMAATALVLLIATANAANLLLARAAARRRELAIRAAMGAGRGELMGQLLSEALLLASGGAACGLALGWITLKLLMAEIGGDEPVQFLTASLQWPVLLFAIALSLATGLLFGLYPAWAAARDSLAVTLKDESGTSSGTHGAARIRQALVCAQVMIAAILLIPTGLFLKSLVNLMHVDLGMNTENLIVFSVAPARNGYKLERNRALFDRVETELAAIPGVRGVTAALVPLISGSNWGNSLKIEGRAFHEDDGGAFNEVSPGYFGKMAIPLVSGREFRLSDDASAPPVAVINQHFAKKLLDGRNPIGLHITADEKPMEIVGVVRDSHYSGVKQEVPNLYYIPWRQDKQLNDLTYYVRTAVPPAQLFPQIRRFMADIDRTLPIQNLRTMETQININIRSDRLVLQLAAVFAVLATLLAMLGLYGVMAHSVTRRTREIGIRMALGAQPRRIRGMVLREMLWILAIGLATGIPAALALARLTESQLYGVKAYDALVVAVAALALAATAVAAAYLPASRAARIDPLRALHYE